MMNVFELGSYIAPAYAGMILAEQKHRVTKYVSPFDAIFDLKNTEAFWNWLNKDKTFVDDHYTAAIDRLRAGDVVIENIRAASWHRHDIDRKQIAEDRRVRWISIEDELQHRSFDVVAQARAWAWTRTDWIRFYIGDTIAGLWAAYSACCSVQSGHFVVGHATSLAKMIELELQDVDRHADRTSHDRETYTMTEDGALVDYKDERIFEPKRTREWCLQNLYHQNMRCVVPLKK